MPDDLFPDRPWGKGNNPKTAVWEYLRRLKEEDLTAVDGKPLHFEIDKTIEKKLLITVAPDGYLNAWCPPNCSPERVTILKRNIAANFAGSLLQALMALLFIPLYIKFLGIEAYGLIGLFMTMQALFMLLDMGLGATVNREMARLSVLPGKAQEMRDLVRSLEVIYWCIAAFIGVAVMVLSSFIAGYWVRPKQLSPEVIRQAILIMGLAIAFQWPVSFYSGGLMGLQRQVLLNIVNTVVAAIRWCGAVLVLWLVSPTIYAFSSGRSLSVCCMSF